MKFTNSVSIYVPSTVNGDVPIPTEDFNMYTHEVVSDMTKQFGGATVYAVTGSYLLPDKSVVTEQLNVVEVFTTSDKLEDLTESAICNARWLKQELRQDSVSIKINGVLHLI